MRTKLALMSCTAFLVLGCTNDAGSTPGESSSGAGPTTNDPDESGTSIDPDGSSSDTSIGPVDTSSESSTGLPTGCGNDMVEDGELCDGADLGGQDCVGQGFDGGTLACAADCLSYDTAACMMTACGNDAIDGKEACDGTDLGGATCVSEGFDEGMLACDANCGALDTSGCSACGNSMVDGDETCDGNAVAGQSCVSQGFDSGMLACNADCQSYDTAACGTCGNDVIDGTEFCDNANLAGSDCEDLGYDSGALACAGNCTGFDFAGCGNCGNSIIDGDEFCDGLSVGTTCQGLGYDSGALSCNADCVSYDVASCGTCGNGFIDGSESCDTLDLGGVTCASIGLEGGELACGANCGFDVTNCDIPGLLFGTDTGYTGYSLTPPALPCDDISLTGTPTLLSDDSVLEVPIGFTFPMYGTDFTDVAIQSNGALHFGSDEELSLTNECLPSDSVPAATNLYVFWDDLNPATGSGEVYYQTLGSDGDFRFVVQWDTAHFGGDGVDFVRLQSMLMQSTGQIIVCYPDTLSANDIGNNGAEATSGIQRDSGEGFEFSCNTPDLVDGLQLLYIPA
jgi:hypothetical protein